MAYGSRVQNQLYRIETKKVKCWLAQPREQNRQHRIEKSAQHDSCGAPPWWFAEAGWWVGDEGTLLGADEGDGRVVETQPPPVCVQHVARVVPAIQRNVSSGSPTFAPVSNDNKQPADKARLS